ncbi:MAG TPA: (d)CMP kinase [Gammaproteobacteria bacterium]|nr:(d)CMP kinase [Gammaproteobacteria bacterium]
MTSTIPVIAIDGPSGSGKGVITQRLATTLGFHILDSGALYRLIGLAARKHGVNLENESALADLAEKLDVSFKPTGDAEDPLSIWLEGDNVTRDVRTDEAGMDASKVAPMASVREAIGLLQRSFKQAPGLVADGRDMGTVVFPDADAKIYLTASAEARAERRYKQLKDKDISVSLHALFTSIRERDERDMTRKVAPLIPASAAAIIDSTSLSIDEVFDQVLAIVTGRLD